jgi:carbon-monoxide dehydrogenase small subunit
VPQRVELIVNGDPHQLDLPANRLLIDCLRYDLGLTGAKEGCSVGVCGACTVLIDGQMAASCITLAVAVDGCQISTIEGLAREGLGQPGNLHPVQQAFVDHGGFQCGICTPGQVMAAAALLESNPDPTEEEVRQWMMGNLCRCTGYYSILESVVNAAKLSRADGR